MGEDQQRPSKGVAGLAARGTGRTDVRRYVLLDAATTALVARSKEPERVDQPITRRDLGRPRWICFHIVAWGFAALAVRLGWWQLTVSNRKGFDLQNFGYWLQWWALAVFALLFWARAIYLARRPPADQHAEGIVVGHSSGAIVPAGGARGVVVPPGAVELVAPDSSPDNPLVYRGYKMPSTREAPVRSHGDTYHNDYNDYLWEIAVADGDTPDGRPT